MTSPRRTKPGGRDQRGVALITAVLIVAIAASISIAVGYNHQLTLAHSDGLLNFKQALQYVYGAEDVARIGLKYDRENSTNDHPDEQWAQPVPPFPFDGGWVQGRLRPADAKLNLNDLVTPSGAADPVMTARLGRLLSRAGFEERITNAIIDWIDRDSDAREGGAEDAVYLAKTPPYRAANRPMQDISELRLVDGIDADSYDALQDWVTALPQGATLNVHFASPEVLASLSDRLQADEVEKALQRGIGKSRKTYASLQDFLSQAVFAGKGVSTDRLSISSRYFELLTEVAHSDTRLRMLSRFRRESNGVAVLIDRRRSHL